MVREVSWMDTTMGWYSLGVKSGQANITLFVSACYKYGMLFSEVYFNYAVRLGSSLPSHQLSSSIAGPQPGIGTLSALPDCHIRFINRSAQAG